MLGHAGLEIYTDDGTVTISPQSHVMKVYAEVNAPQTITVPNEYGGIFVFYEGGNLNKSYSVNGRQVTLNSAGKAYVITG